jgi:NTP pyrophosphatase (non-canonical NTP hydrolase)
LGRTRSISLRPIYNLGGIAEEFLSIHLSVLKREGEVEIAEFQRLMADIYLEKDSLRGKWDTYAWLIEEVGELSRAIRRGDVQPLCAEFADVFAWLASLANLCGIELNEALEKYRHGCPKCLTTPCSCPSNRSTRSGSDDPPS